MTVRRCPHCATAEQGDGRPGCACRAAPSDREAASDRAADFSPLLLRPYIRIPEPGERGHPPMAPGGRSSGAGPGVGQRAAPDGDPPKDDGTGGAVAGGGGTGPAEAGTATRPPGGRAPTTPVTEGPRGDAARGRRHRARTVAGVSAAVLAVPGVLVGIWVAAENTFDHAGPDRYTAEPTMVLPTDEGDSPSPASASPSPSASRTSVAPAPETSRHSASPSAPATTGGVHSSGSTTPSATHQTHPPERPPVLRMGDTGPEVVELQRRLAQLDGLYTDKADGVYDSGVVASVTTFQILRSIKDDEPGVYGLHTRAALERVTSEPS